METNNEEQEDCNYKLSRHEEGFSPETVLLIGNGVIENGNIPLEEVAFGYETSSEYGQHKKSEHTQELAIVLLARMAFYYRSNAERLLLKAARIEKLNEDNFREIDEIGPYLHIVRNFIIKLAKAYNEATKSSEISFRDRALFNKFYSNDSTGIVTINWDEVLWNDSSIDNIIQLHGRCSISDSLVLPTEMIIDANIFKLHEENLLKNNVALKTDYLSRYFRGTKNIRQSLEDAHGIAYDWLRNAKTMIIWGIAFNAYDAELISLFQSPPFNELEKIVIINTNSDHGNIAKEIVGEGAVRIDIDPITGEEIN